METDGEGVGGGGNAERRERSDLGRLLEAIGSSSPRESVSSAPSRCPPCSTLARVLEKRIPLVKQLEEEFCADDLGLILQGLLVCHTAPYTGLQVALKCSDLEMTDHLRQFLTLGAKASSWSGKHVQWSAKCIDQSQVTAEEEEHDRLRLEVNSLSLNICTKLLDIAAKYITVQGLQVAKGEDGHGAKKEECVSTKAEDAFPTLETTAVDVEPAPAHLVAGMSPDQEVSRCTHCASEKTPQWHPGPDGTATLCNACWQKGQLLHSKLCRRRGRPPIKDRRCMHCGLEKTSRWLRGPDGPGTLCRECGQRFLKGHLLHSNPRHQGHRSLKGRRCMHCGSENTPRWLRGPDGPATLCNACGQKFYKGRLLHYNSRRGSSSKEDSVAGNGVAALAEALPCDVRASLDAFFDHTGWEVSWGKGAGPELGEEEEELEWLSNKDAFPSVETMAVEVEEEASAPDVPQARTKGRRRVTAMETAAADRVTVAEARHGEESMEEQLLPERPPADRPAFSLVSHGPVLKRRRKSEAQTFASIRRTAKDGRAIRAAARLAAMDN